MTAPASSNPLATLGKRPEDVQTILLTHAHLDHLGGVPAIQQRHDVHVITGEQEAHHARGEYHEQVTPVQMLGQCRHRPGRRWLAATLRAVLPHPSVTVKNVTGVRAGEVLDTPGHLVPVTTPGHTRGHTAWHMPSAGIVFTGDALVTHHALSRWVSGPQVLLSMFHADEPEMVRSLDILRGLEADTVVPGHGP